MKLWLDDVRPPPKKNWWEWSWAKSVAEAIEKVERSINECQRFEEASLDHDLGTGDREDGIYFIDWMAETNNWPAKKPVIHSMNPVGRQRMEMTINRYFLGEK